MVEAASSTLPITSGDEHRKGELELLELSFAAEHGAVFVIHGRRGVGKARLAEELAKKASTTPRTAVFEGHNPHAGARSFHPFAEIAHQAMVWAETQHATESLIDPLYQDLAAVLDRVAAEADFAPSLDQKLRFFDSFRRLLAGISERSRLLVVVHDLERADNDTLELASYLGDELFGDPALDPKNPRAGALIFTLRDDLDAASAQAARVRDFLAESIESRTVRTMHLEGLDLDGLRRYVQSPRVLEKLLAASHGLPQEIDALIDSLPTNVEELFQRKLAQLDVVAKSALAALAISGRPASARAITEVTGHPMKTVAQSLSELRDARVLERRIAQGEFQFSFARRSDLEVTARTLSADERARYHGAWAAALAKEPEHGGASLLAHHQLRSSEPSRGVPLAIQAAEAHAVAGAFDAAVQMLEDARPHANGELLLAILGRLAELAPLTGSPKAALRYVEAWKAALPEAQRGRAYLREAELHNAAGDHDDALFAIDEARRVTAENAVVERAQIAATESEAHYQKGALDRANAAGELGLLLLERLETDVPPRVELELVNQLGKIALAADAQQKAIDLFTRTLALAEQSGLRREQARALVNLGLASLRRGATRDAEAHLIAGIGRAQEANDLSHLAFGHLNLGVVMHQRGELGRAIECYRECKSLFRRLGKRTHFARALHNLANLYLMCGDITRARAYNDEALRIARHSGVERLVAIATALDGLIQGELGDRERGEASLREAMVLNRRLGVERPLDTMMALAELQVQFGDTESAESSLREIQGALAANGNKLLEARARLVEGRIMLAHGDPSAARVLAEAREGIERSDRRVFLRDAELALGRAHQALSERETARMHYSAALEIQKAIARELPEDLRSVFEAARPQVAVREAMESLESMPSVPRAPASGTASRAAQAARAAAAIDTAAAQQVAASAAARAAGSVRRAEWASRYASIIGTSSKLHRVFHIIDRVAPSDGTVLIWGESGTGKELVAEAIHKNSPRAKGAFVKLNCAALVESLLLSELFGHERGSFTGAHQRKIGRFEMAAGGTIFLDEIGDISPKTQVSLLRVLQEREFERVGGGRPIKVEARIIFATNRNLSQMVREGSFREDLYYRLKGLTIDLPPLRERPEDILELSQHFLEQYANESGTLEKKLSRSAEELLLTYAWPGNIRELENIIRSVALFAESATIDGRDFDEYRELFNQGPAWNDKTPVPVLMSAATRAETFASLPATMPPAPAMVAPPAGPLQSSLAAPHAQFAAVAQVPPIAPLTPVAARESDDDDEESMPSSGVTIPPGMEGELLSQIFAQGVPLPELKKRIQDQAIARALRMTKGNITRAAEVLGMRRPRLSQIINASEELKGLCQGGDR